MWLVKLTMVSDVHNLVTTHIPSRRRPMQGDIKEAGSLLQSPLRPKHLMGQNATGKTKRGLAASRVFAEPQAVRLGLARPLSINEMATI